MLLIDAIYVNSDGGRVLLDHLILALENANYSVFYLLDERIKGGHQKVGGNSVVYLKAKMHIRHNFYVRNKNKFTKIFCFGNLPPSVKLNAEVFTYFHNKLFLELSSELTFVEKLKYSVKSYIFRYLLKNTDYVIVQTSTIKNIFTERIIKFNRNRILTIPFYSPIVGEKINSKKKNCYIYVSSGVKYKNHYRLLEGFKIFFDEYNIGELHLTVSDSFIKLNKFIKKLICDGYPVINHGSINRSEVGDLYSKAEYIIYPSLTESFGLGIIEAIENGCKVIGADLPYTYAVCEPSLLFNPFNVDSIVQSFIDASSTRPKDSIQLVHNEVQEIITILK